VTESLRSLKGRGASPGVIRATARVVRSTADFSRVSQGEVVVAETAGPDLGELMPKMGGLVTDRGGVLSHAAVLALSYGIPAVVGTHNATKVIGDGERVMVDGTAGEVTLQ
jgi:phosphoenolpyruvate synthase/pyruvate phosphate dikinase